jgi:hypothetical protein
MRSVAGRKTTPKVKDGRVQRKNRTDESEYLALVDGRQFTVIKHRARAGYCHVLQLPEVYRFVELIPDWPTISKGLSALALDGYGSDEQTDTNYEPGYRSIWMRPFPKTMKTSWARGFHDRHREVLARLGVAPVAAAGNPVTVTWTASQAKAWQLLHLFLYDLGVHDQFMRGQNPRTEHSNEEAEDYVFTTAERILPAYERVIGRIE